MIDLSEKRLTALENRYPSHYLAHAVADRVPHLLHLWLLAAQKILAGSGGHTADDRHRYRGPGQPAQWLSSRGSA